MKKMLIALFVTLVPLALFAQAPGVDKQPTDRPAVDRPAVDRTADLLKSFKLRRLCYFRGEPSTGAAHRYSRIAHLRARFPRPLFFI